MTDKEIIRTLMKEIDAGRKWMSMAYKHPDDEGKTEPAWKAWRKAMERTEQVRKEMKS